MSINEREEHKNSHTKKFIENDEAFADVTYRNESFNKLFDITL